MAQSDGRDASEAGFEPRHQCRAEATAVVELAGKMADGVGEDERFQPGRLIEPELEDDQGGEATAGRDRGEPFG